MQKSKIEWLATDGRPGYSWNPIKGLCPVGCWYCFAGKMYRRFKLDPTLRVDFAEINAPFPTRPSRIFLCSTMELWHPEVDKLQIRDAIFEIIASAPQHTFIILTKLPERIDRPMPDNVWIGVSVTNQEDADKRIPILLGAEAQMRFVSIEPTLGPVSLVGRLYGPNWLEGWEALVAPDKDGSPVPFQSQTNKLNWVIVGRLTGHGHKYDPRPAWIEAIVRECRAEGTPIFMKNNLSVIWPGKLIQEWSVRKD